MTKKVNNTIGLAQDIIKGWGGITLNDRTHASTSQYFIKKFKDDVTYNIGMKNKNIARLVGEQEEHVAEANCNRELLDQDAMLQRERDIEWNRKQIEIAETLHQYLSEASQQIFPEQHNKSEQTAKQLEDLVAQYS